MTLSVWKTWSGREDSNLRPLRPERKGLRAKRLIFQYSTYRHLPEHIRNHRKFRGSFTAVERFHLITYGPYVTLWLPWFDTWWKWRLHWCRGFRP